MYSHCAGNYEQTAMVVLLRGGETLICRLATDTYGMRRHRTGEDGMRHTMNNNNSRNGLPSYLQHFGISEDSIIFLLRHLLEQLVRDRASVRARAYTSPPTPVAH